MAIERGMQVEVTTALGERVPMRALGAPQQGRDFEVIWVATVREYDRAVATASEPDGIPWPVEAVRELQPQ